MTAPRTGILVTIYRYPNLDCTKDGVTCLKRAPQSLAILLGVERGNYTEGELPGGYPVLELVRRTHGVGPDYVTARPVGETRRVMSGGNFVYSSDSRFHEAVGHYPISVHDRVES